MYTHIIEINHSTFYTIKQSDLFNKGYNNHAQETKYNYEQKSDSAVIFSYSIHSQSVNKLYTHKQNITYSSVQMLRS